VVLFPGYSGSYRETKEEGGFYLGDTDIRMKRAAEVFEVSG